MDDTNETCAFLYSMALNPANHTKDPTNLEQTQIFLNSVVNPALCVFGIIGNCLNMFVLTRKKFQSSLDCNHERVAVIGLIMLAVSDTLYCISALPKSAIGRRKIVSWKADFLFMYQIYGDGVKAYFTYTSNWLTVLTAVSRYLAICRPLQTRGLISNRAVAIAVACICVFWALFILPIFWTSTLDSIHCPDQNISVYFQYPGYFVNNKNMKLTFSTLWTIFGSFIPIILLVYCNFHLIKAVRESLRLREVYRVHSRNRNPGSNITPTLVAVICMFVLCTSPSEILNMFFYHVGQKYAEEFVTAIVIANVLLTLNYSINFLLYCFVNSRFRKTIDYMLRCSMLRSMKRQFSFSTRAAGSRHRQTQLTYNISNMSDTLAQQQNEVHLLNKTDLSPCP